jgi:hypothetical protein
MVTDALVRTRLEELLHELDPAVQLVECRSTGFDGYVVRLVIEGAAGRPLFVPTRVLHRALESVVNPMARRILTGVLAMNVQALRAGMAAAERKTA